MPSAEAADQLLSHAFARYERAVASGPRGELVAARAALCVALEESGAALPVPVRDQLWRDQKLLRELQRERTSGAAGLVRPPSHRPASSPEEPRAL